MPLDALSREVPSRCAGSLKALRLGAFRPMDMAERPAEDAIDSVRLNLDRIISTTRDVRD